MRELNPTLYTVSIPKHPITHTIQHTVWEQLESLTHPYLTDTL